MRTEDIEISGLAELAERLPDDQWYEIRIRIRKADGGAEVLVDPDITPVAVPHS